MVKFTATWILLLPLACTMSQSAIAETAWLAPLAQGTAPDCPNANGARDSRSEIAQFGVDEAYITGSASTQDGKCQKTLTLHLKHGDTDQTFPLPPEGQDYFIVDYSPDHSRLLTYTAAFLKFPNEQFRNVTVTVMSAVTGEKQSLNAWDLFGWKDCDAMVEPQGFTEDGKPVVLARPSVMQPPRHQSCVSDWGLYAVDMKAGKATRLPDGTKLKRYAGLATAASQSCANDPDVVAACFTVHGRLSFWNGTPTTRIWWIGTKHMLGVRNEIIPGSVAKHMQWGVEAYGDFRVCPLEKPKPRSMQDVCIDSASNVIYKSN